MASSLRDAPLCQQPRQVETRLHAIHLQWVAEQQTLTREEQWLLSLHQHQAQLRLVVRDTSCGTAPALREKLARIEEQIAQTHGRIAEQTQRCLELATQFDAVQVTLAVVRRQARQQPSAWSFTHLLSRLLRSLFQGVLRLVRWLLKQRALSDVGWWEGGQRL